VNLTETISGQVSCALNAGVVGLLQNLTFSGVRSRNRRDRRRKRAQLHVLSCVELSARRTRQFEAAHGLHCISAEQPKRRVGALL